MSATPVVKVSVRNAEITLRAGRTRVVLSAIDSLELAGRLEVAAVAAERQVSE